MGWSDIASLRLYRLATAELIQGRPGIRATVGLLLFVIPVVEWNIGPRLTLTVMLLGDWMSTVPVLAGLRIVGGLGNTHAMTTALMRDGGTSSAVHALAAAATSKMSSRVARRSVIALVGVEIAVSTAIAPRLFDLQHAISAVAGLALGRWLLAAHAT